MQEDPAEKNLKLLEFKPIFSPRYARHEPEKTVLYKVVAEHWNTFRATTEQDPEGYGLPKYIQKEFDAYLKCGILQYRFLRVHCESCKMERLVAFQLAFKSEINSKDSFALLLHEYRAPH